MHLFLIKCFEFSVGGSVKNEEKFNFYHFCPSEGTFLGACFNLGRQHTHSDLMLFH